MKPRYYVKETERNKFMIWDRETDMPQSTEKYSHRGTARLFCKAVNANYVTMNADIQEQRTGDQVV